ncbi:MAG: D-sedoheptulose 7-phosphate isomerase [Thermodesulfovibrionia bacterium]|nr:D-sedoheptulose 7-phosphate isomerase [Thermodesulfovibrionia bacterium]
MREKILKAFEDSASVKREFIKANIDAVIEVSNLIAEAFNSGSKLMVFGNGGSSTDAAHIAAEFVGRFKMERPALPAIDLNTNMAVVTAIANDYDFSEIFVRQIKAHAQDGDVAIGISTSGNSQNVIKAIEEAKKRKIRTIVFTGAKGGKLAAIADHVFAVPSSDTPRIQETHITLGHVLCQMVEEILFESHRNR